MQTHADFHRRSLVERDAFWAEQARRIDWQTRPSRSATPAARHLRVGSSAGRPTSATTPWTGIAAQRPTDRALIWVSTETNQGTYLQLYRASGRGGVHGRDPARAGRGAETGS